MEGKSIPVRVHASQFPEAVRERLLKSIREREVHNQFHYASYKQAQRWLRVTHRFSPFANDPDCRAAYLQAYQFAGQLLSGAKALDVIGLGCGSAEKDVELMRAVQRPDVALRYTPVDASVPLVLAAHRNMQMAGFDVATGLVCDLGEVDDLNEIGSPAGSIRLMTLFGMLPNFKPELLLRSLGCWLLKGEFLVFSANLVSDYVAGMPTVLPQYDNALTNDWLLTFVNDLGIDLDAGRLQWVIEKQSDRLQNFAAYFEFGRNIRIEIEDQPAGFARDEKLKLFASYRYTTELVHQLFPAHGFAILSQCVTKSGEEGVFLSRRV